MPPSISRAGAGACTTMPVHDRQASFGRLVTITRNCAGITSSRSELSSPITVIACPTARARGVLGRQRHLDPRQVRSAVATAGTPLGRIVQAPLGISLLRLRVFFGNRLLEGFQTQLQLFLRQTLRAGTEMHASQLQQQMTQPVILCQECVSLDRRIALGHRRQHQRPQCFDAFRQALHVVAGGDPSRNES